MSDDFGAIASLIGNLAGSLREANSAPTAPAQPVPPAFISLEAGPGSPAPGGSASEHSVGVSGADPAAVDSLQDAGFTSDPGDRDERLYAPGSSVDATTISPEAVNLLIRAGWRGDPQDRQERLYAP